MFSDVIDLKFIRADKENRMLVHKNTILVPIGKRFTDIFFLLVLYSSEFTNTFK